MSGQESALSRNNSFEINLEFFSGPMDLLLHLVSQQEVSIENVKMSVIAEQYLEIVSAQASSLDLDTACEYLVIAATLLAIKSKALLPNDTLDQEFEEDGLDDPTRFFETLREKLKAYQITKQRAEALIKTPQLGVDRFSRSDKSALKPTPEMLGEPEDGLDLGRMFATLLKRIGQASVKIRILAEPVSVIDYMMRILDKLSISPNEAFDGNSTKRGFIAVVSSLLPDRPKETPLSKGQMRGSVIAGFVAVLELMKRGVLEANQESQNTEIGLDLVIATDETSLTIDEIKDSRSLTSVHEDAVEQAQASDSKVVSIEDYKKSNQEKSKNQEKDNLKEDMDVREVGNV